MIWSTGTHFSHLAKEVGVTGRGLVTFHHHPFSLASAVTLHCRASHVARAREQTLLCYLGPISQPYVALHRLSCRPPPFADPDHPDLIAAHRREDGWMDGWCGSYANANEEKNGTDVGEGRTRSVGRSGGSPSWGLENGREASSTDKRQTYHCKVG